MVLTSSPRPIPRPLLLKPLVLYYCVLHITFIATASVERLTSLFELLSLPRIMALYLGEKEQPGREGEAVNNGGSFAIVLL